ncbi:MAG: hypothetical protein HOV79_35020 [Hamadaea sp.]|nr:hypothetical protein [Hamadaea sp.]
MILTLTTVDLAGAQAPDVCARHGRPAVARHDLNLVARTKRPGDPMITDTNIGGMITRAADEFENPPVRVPGWPLCATCLTRRRTGIAATKALVVAAPILLIAALVLGLAAGPGAVSTALFAAGLLALPLALWTGLNARVAGLARITVDADRTVATLRDPSPAFLEQWRQRNPGLAQAR